MVFFFDLSWRLVLSINLQSVNVMYLRCTPSIKSNTVPFCLIDLKKNHHHNQNQVDALHAFEHVIVASKLITQAIQFACAFEKENEYTIQ